MSRSLTRAGAALFVAASLAVLAPACADNRGSIFIRQCQAQPADSCIAEADPSGLFRGKGVLDVAYGGSYGCPLLVGNQLVPRADANRGFVETSRIQLTLATVTLYDQSGGTLTHTIDGEQQPIQFQVQINGFVDPGSQSSPGYGIAFVELVDRESAKEIARAGLNQNPQQFFTEVVAGVVLEGETLGGVALETDEWTFPVTICVGCLCDPSPCVVGSTQTDKPTPNCRPGRDASVDCRLTGGACPDFK